MVKPVLKSKSRCKIATKLIILMTVVCIVSIGSTMSLKKDASFASTLLSSIEDMTRDTTTITDINSSAAVSDKVFEDPKPESTTEIIDISNDQNALIKEKRKALLDKCTDSRVEEGTLEKEFFTTLPDSSKDIPKQMPKPSIKRCKNIVLDFGANVGDTAGHLIDAGLPNCKADVDANSYHRLMLGDRKVELGKWNMVTKFLKQMMDANKLYPEDYCYYGIEGNPVFTERLQGIEDYINSIEPSPLAHASFLTESVGAGEYGMTKLYLDTVNTKENFWGSSIMKNHQDVRKSMNEGNMTEAPAHDVMGYTITKLMDMTLLGLKEDATDEEKKGAHLLLKVDIEGGEYVLTQEVVESKALCKFVEMGNKVDVVIETHSQRVTGPNPLAFKFGGWRKELEECGVTFRNLQAWWA